MFHEKLERLLLALGANNAQIARYAGFDRTNISRLRSGARVPRRDGPTAEKLVSGLYLFADNRNELGKLCAVFGGNANASAEEIKAALSAWLYDGLSRAEPERKHPGKAAGYRSFGEKLDGVMTLAELSNVRLSRMVNVDASLISRFRTGVRTPRSNPELTALLCRALLRRVRELEKKEELSAVLKCPMEALDEESLMNWLCELDDRGGAEALAVERLLEDIDGFSVGGFPPVAALPERVEDSRECYYGREGIQAAVVRFLSSAAHQGAGELWLYSDQSMAWMVEDPAFRAQWFGLMNACVSRGTRIRIIHNIDRELGEMVHAINSWLPLYMSGMIESYTCKRKSDGRFSHTIFLSPDMACIEAFHVLGTEDTGLYHYHTEPEELASFRTAFERLLAESRPLLRLSRQGGTELLPGEYSVIQSTLSLATMPEELAVELLEPARYREWERQRAYYEECLRTGCVYECIPAAGDEELYEGTVPVEPLSGCDERYYTPEQYARHIRNIIRLSERFPNYRFYRLPKEPFRNMRLMIGPDSVVVTRTLPPVLTFRSSHPLMCSAFQAYVRSLMERYKIDRNTLRRELGRY